MHFTSQIGRCLLMCQEAEAIFAFIIMMKRHPGIHAFDETLLAELIKIRTTFFGRLEEELIASSDGLLDRDKVTAFSQNRNWLVHHLILDPRYVATSKTGGFDLSRFLLEFTTGLDHFRSAYEKLAIRDGAAERAQSLAASLSDLVMHAASVSNGIIHTKDWSKIN